MPPRSKPTPTDEQLERERKALELRRAGLTFDAIAEQIGYTDRSLARRAYLRAMSRTMQQPADEIRELESDRLDRLLVAVWSKAIRGDLPSVDRALRISERRARLLGLDYETGLLERQVRLNEATALILVEVLRDVLGTLGHNPDEPQVAEIVASRLQQVAERPAISA